MFFLPLFCYYLLVITLQVINKKTKKEIENHRR